LAVPRLYVHGGEPVCHPNADPDAVPEQHTGTNTDAVTDY
jgi:hypothetical protein